MDINIIQGGIATDKRGNIRFTNDFKMVDVRRFYLITNADCEIIRGWRAHRIEQRWFYVISGSFEVNIVKIDNWDQPSSELEVKKMILNSSENKLLHLPTGYGTTFKSIDTDSILLVFSDFDIDNAVNDNYTYDLNYFKKAVFSEE